MVAFLLIDNNVITLSRLGKYTQKGSIPTEVKCCNSKVTQ